MATPCQYTVTCLTFPILLLGTVLKASSWCPPGAEVASNPMAEKEELTAALHLFMIELFSEAQIVMSLRSKYLVRLAT